MESPLQQAFYKIQSLKQEVDRLQEQLEPDIAIIGAAIDFPEAPDLSTFWQHLLAGKSSIRPIPTERKEQVTDGLNASPGFEEKGYLQRISGFDPAFFGITEKEAVLMNPSQRLFLKNAWQVLEDGGYSGPVVSEKNVGVFVGYSGDLSFKEYLELLAKTEAPTNAATVIGNSSAILPGRISHLLNLHGPSMVIDTACSSSLVAVYEAVNSLQNGSCDMAIASGVQIEILPHAAKYQVGFESADGSMKPFDKNARGTVSGEGLGSVLLKPLKAAIADRDHIYAVIKGGAINHDGLSSSITAPNLAAQVELLKKSWADAKIKPEELHYIETHGTGTQLGDPIELSALMTALGPRSGAQSQCYAGSVKANIGHLFASAGIASLIKCLLLVNHRIIPRQINLESPIDDLLKPDCSIVFNTENLSLPPDGPLLCGISSFGFSGTNCHLVLSAFEAPAIEHLQSEEVDVPALFTISGKTQAGLVTQVEAFRAFLQAGPESDYRDLCFTRNVGRAHHKYRCAFVIKNRDELTIGLEACSASLQHSNVALLNGNSQSAGTLIRLNQMADALLQQPAGAPGEWLQELADYYLQGADISWANLYVDGQEKRVVCPVYLFAEKDFWPTLPRVQSTVSATIDSTDIQEELVRLAAEMTGLDASEFQLEAEFFELGVDSLVLLQMIEAIKSKYNVTLQIGQFYEDIVTLEHLLRYIEKNWIPPTPSVEAKLISPLPVSDSAGSVDFSEIIQRLDRIEAKMGVGGGSRPKASLDAGSIYYGNPILQEHRPLSAAQKAFLAQFIPDYQSKTAGSKNYSAEHRAYFADWINSIDYRHSLKELLYPIVSQKAAGAKVWDIDGNEYIDIGLGYGISFFGNNPEFIKKALSAQLDQGFELAFQTQLAGDIAAQICALTGVERVTFSNTGTEAVMAAMRIARAKTRKPKIVIFTGSYHGTFDGVLGMKGESDHQTLPISSGTPPGFVEDLLVLNFGAKESLEIIAEHAGSIAAVLLEPVQSRKPDVHLGDYIRQLRTLTAQLGIALIFDEIITGFRIGAGGAQAYFGVQADLVTYGKVIGGGMPLGIVAGKHEFMDLIDGGDWRFGDDSYPAVKKVLFGGTFCKHPLALAAVAAVMEKIKTEGDVFYTRVNGLADYLSDTLNVFFQAEEIPIAMVHFGSLFRFDFKGKYQALNNPLEIPVFFYLLNYHGVYTWERRICFLSTEHSKVEIDQIIAAVKRTVQVMKANGWFEGSVSRELVPAADLQPLFHSQLRLWMLDQFNGGQMAYNLGYAYKIEGDFQPAILEKAFVEVLQRHEILRGHIVLHDHSPLLRIRSMAEITPVIDFRDMSGQPDSAALALLKNTIWEKFDLGKDLLIRLQVIRQDLAHYIAISVHHIVADGWSVNVLFSEIGRIYQKLVENVEAQLPAPKRNYQDLLAEENAYLKSDQLALDQAFWLEQLTGELPKLDFPAYKKRPVVQSNHGKMSKFAFSRETTGFLLEFAKKEKISLYVALLGLVKIVLHKYTHQQDIIIGTSVHGRKSSEHFQSVGNFINNIALRSRVKPESSVHELLQEIKKTLFEAFEHQHYPFDLLVEHLKIERDLSRSPIFDVLVQIESGDLTAYYQTEEQFSGLSMALVDVEDDSAERDLFIEFVHHGEDLSVKINYNTDVFEDFQIPLLFAHLQAAIQDIRQLGSGRQIRELDLLLPAEKAFLEGVNQTSKPFPAESNFVRIFELQARENPAASALQFEDRLFSYETLNRQANQFARYLLDRSPETPIVGLLMNRGPQMVAAILATWKSGKAYVPIDPDYPLQRIVEIAAEAGVTVFITDQLSITVFDALQNELSSATCEGIDFSTAEKVFGQLPDTNLDVEIDPHDLAYVLFTSGSTGKPKGAMVEHVGMLNHMCAKVNDLDLGDMMLPESTALPEHVFSLNAIQQERWQEHRNPAFQSSGVSHRIFAWDRPTVEVAVLERAFAGLFHQYSFLTSRFESINGTVVRIEAPGEMRYSSLTIHLDPNQAPDAFYPLPGRLFKAQFSSTPNGSFSLQYWLHELIASRSFIETIHTTLLANYQLLLAAPELPLPKSELNYAYATTDPVPAFAQWLAQNLKDYQRQAFNIGRFNRDNGQTQARLSGWKFDAATAKKLRQYAGQLELSLEELLYGAICLLVHKYTGSSDQVTLDVAFELDSATDTGTIPQTNRLPLLNRVEKTSAVEATVIACAQAYRQLAGGKSFPYSALTELLAATSESGIPAIEKSVLFRFQQKTGPSERPAAEQHSFYVLEFDFLQDQDDLTLQLSANESIIDDTVAAQICEHVKTLLLQLLDGRAKTVSALGYISDREKLRILQEFNPPSPGYGEAGFIQLFEQNVLLYADHPAVVFEGRSYTYDHINRTANRLARLMTERFGTGTGNKVGILMDRSEKMLIVLLAVLKTGAAYVPLDLHFPEERVRFILSDAAVDLLIMEGESTMDLHYEHLSPVLHYADIREALGTYAEDNPAQGRSADHLFSVLHTSGTTGLPKGVQLRDHNVTALFDWGLDTFRHDPFDHVLACTPICFDVSTFELFFPLLKGKTLLFFPDNFSMENFQMLLNSYPRIALHTSPTFIGTLVEEQLDMRNVSVLNLAGEPVPVSFRRIFKDKNIEVRNLYGPCETTVYSACYLFDDQYEDIVPIGKPLRHEQLYIVDDQLMLAPLGGIGEICIAGAGVSTGYLNRPELTAEKFVDAPFAPGVRMYRTGDFGRYLPDGNIEFLGRKDNQVKIRGYRIELGEIENTLNRMDHIIASTVDMAIDKQGESHLVAYYISSNGTAENEVRDYLVNTLPYFMMPSYIIRLEALPKTINGKVDKSRLPKPAKLSSPAGSLPKLHKRDRRIVYQAGLGTTTIAQNASHCFDISVWQMFTAHLVGGKTVIYGNDLIMDALAFIKNVQHDEITVLEVVPSYLNLILTLFEEKKLDPGLWSKLSCLVSTGEELKGNLVNRWFKIFPGIPMVNAYGPTEASDDITHQFIYEPIDHHRPVPVGRPVQNMQIFVLDEHRQVCPVGIKGTLHVSGIGVGKGYIRQPEKTAAVFFPSPFDPTARMYNTGDIGRYLSDGTLEFFGRLDAQIKIRGNRIELGEIDSALTAITDVKEAVTLLKKQADKEAVLVAYVTCRQKLEPSFLRSELAKRIPLMPDEIIILDALPLNANGKIDRKALLNRSSPVATKRAVAPAEPGDTTSIVRKYWIDVLGHRDFSDTDSFFEHGGNSLKLMKLFRLIDDHFPEKIKIPDLFRKVSVAEQSRLLTDDLPADIVTREKIVELDF